LSPRRLRVVPLISALVLAWSAALAPVATGADALSLTTPFPAVSVSPGNRVSFNLSVKTSASARVGLSLSGVPSSWTATLHGGGFVVSAVQTSGTDATEVRLDIDVPADATGTTRITVTAEGNGARDSLPLDITSETNASGEVKVTSDITSQKGPSDQTFTFNVNVLNQKDQDLTYSSTAGQTPPGWTVNTSLTGSSQATSATVKAGGTSGVTVTVKAADGTEAGTYPVQIVTTVGTEQFTTDLNVEITGSYKVEFAADQILSARGPAGGVTEQTFTITNTGTAPVTNLVMSGTPPSGWTVKFDPTSTDSLAPDQSVTVKAQITPSGDAIAGDYNISFKATAKEANVSSDVRFTVETSILGAIIGAALIVAAVGGLYWVFRRYGRR
jgi:uncharacterized repeat protein (TIGR01451 family)